MNSKDTMNSDGNERAVSPVIGVILMVAITVILAAVIAAFVLDLGQGQSASASAGVEFTEDGDHVKTQLIQVDRADSIYVRVTVDGSTYWVAPNGAHDSSDRTAINSWDVGSSLSINSTSPGTNDDLSSLTGSNLESITVIGEYQGEDTVIQSWDE
ncbi:type IV pilin N-terminal domain-containing protein [Natrinema sp. 1APR25-10V2]|uniref:type IV pilin N-terminal domain-containing protein n=1 Tax=Natrinema sp. 1APR25-10V2 TaxID=2951081 RepID=UPI002875EE60|nr:type IV pilin N-terminal domain-containing protein [Natrinema sp. 1APR25-10V2]MDS0475280.1 type IV pilin N-terminal domain-containing protein [Natrinema sp. 1APR25-10V2]